MRVIHQHNKQTPSPTLPYSSQPNERSTAGRRRVPLTPVNKIHNTIPAPSATTRYSSMRKGTIFLANLPYDLKKSELEDLLTSRVGPGIIKSIRINTHQSTGACRGFGYMDIYDEKKLDEVKKITMIRSSIDYRLIIKLLLLFR